MARRLKGKLVPVVVGFNYDLLETKVAEQVRSSADRIRERLKKTLVDIIEVGHDLQAAKKSLEHGQFGPWLRAEFGWTERTAQNFMSVAERFGAKTEIISDLRIAPTAAYLLAAPSVPDEARAKAIERAESGETITAKLARKILAEAKRKRGRRRAKAVPAEKLHQRLVKALERFHERWDPEELEVFAEALREFADTLDGRVGKKKG